MNKEMLDILNDLSKKPTTELALQIMELSGENLILEQQVKKQKEIIDKAVLELVNIDGNLSNSQLSDKICNLINILKEVSK